MVAGSAFVACSGDNGGTPGDNGGGDSGLADSGTTNPMDTGTPADTGTNAADSGGGSKDSGQPAADSGHPAADSGQPAEDSGQPGEDSGQDSGQPEMDSGPTPLPPTLLGTQIDRMGRAAINTALNHAFDPDAGSAGAAKNAYNADLDVPAWPATYAAEFATNLAILDSLDTGLNDLPGRRRRWLRQPGVLRRLGRRARLRPARRLPRGRPHLAQRGGSELHPVPGRRAHRGGRNERLRDGLRRSSPRLRHHRGDVLDRRRSAVHSHPRLYERCHPAGEQGTGQDVPVLRPASVTLSRSAVIALLCALAAEGGVACSKKAPSETGGAFFIFHARASSRCRRELVPRRHARVQRETCARPDDERTHRAQQPRRSAGEPAAHACFLAREPGRGARGHRLAPCARRVHEPARRLRASLRARRRASQNSAQQWRSTPRSREDAWHVPPLRRRARRARRRALGQGRRRSRRRRSPRPTWRQGRFDERRRAGPLEGPREPGRFGPRFGGHPGRRTGPT